MPHLQVLRCGRQGAVEADVVIRQDHEEIAPAAVDEPLVHAAHAQNEATKVERRLWLSQLR